VQVHCDEGVAIHVGSEPCVVASEGRREASAGERIGQPLSRESTDECFEDIAWTALQSITDFSPGERPKHMVNPAAWNRRALG
jgi:hypothetical protein